MTSLPSLDCHAHIAPDVTAGQLARLGPSIVFAMTRSLREARDVSSRADQRVVWGLGVHPANVTKSGEIDLTLFRSLLPRFALVGEIGLDRRSGHLRRQIEVLTSLLEAAKTAPVFLSIHSAGCVEETLNLLEEHPHPGVILHWFTGDEHQLERASDLGCYFSVNVAMDEPLLSRIPMDRLLPETDYPATRRKGVRLPGDTAQLEELIGLLHGMSSEDVRRQFYRNLRALSLACGAIDRLPEYLSDLLILA